MLYGLEGFFVLLVLVASEAYILGNTTEDKISSNPSINETNALSMESISNLNNDDTNDTKQDEILQNNFNRSFDFDWNFSKNNVNGSKEEIDVNGNYSKREHLTNVTMETKLTKGNPGNEMTKRNPGNEMTKRKRRRNRRFRPKNEHELRRKAKGIEYQKFHGHRLRHPHEKRVRKFNSSKKGQNISNPKIPDKDKFKIRPRHTDIAQVTQKLVSKSIPSTTLTHIIRNSSSSSDRPKNVREKRNSNDGLNERPAFQSKPYNEYQETVYEEYDEDYEIFAYTSLTALNSTPMSFLDLDFDESEKHESENVETYLLFPDENKNVEKEFLKQFGQPHKGDQRFKPTTRKSIFLNDEFNPFLPITELPDEVPDYFEYYDEYDYVYEDESLLDKQARESFEKMRTKPEETMEEVYFLPTTPSKGILDPDGVQNAQSMFDEIKSTINESADDNETTTNARVTVKSKNTKKKPSDSTPSTALPSTSFPLAFPPESYYDSNYDELYDDDFYDQNLDPLLDVNLNRELIDGINKSRSAKKTLSLISGNKTGNKSHKSTSHQLHKNSSDTSEISDSSEELKKLNKSSNIKYGNRRPDYSAYYDNIYGLNMNYENSEKVMTVSQEDEFDKHPDDETYYDYENNSTLNLNVEWFDKLEGGGTNGQVRDGLIEPKLRNDGKNDTKTGASSNVHVLDRKPFQPESKHICYLTGGRATDMFLQADKAEGLAENFNNLPCTHLVIGMAKVIDNRLTNPSWVINKKIDEIRNIVGLIKKARPNMAIIMAVGDSKECPSYALGLWETHESRNYFIDSVIELLRMEDIDGLEYHYIRYDMSDKEMEILLQLVKETYITFRTDAINMRLNKLSLSIAFQKHLRKKLNDITSGVKLKDLNRYLDFTNVIIQPISGGNDEEEYPFLYHILNANSMVKHVLGQGVDIVFPFNEISTNGSKGRMTKPKNSARCPGFVTFNQFIGNPNDPKVQNDESSPFPPPSQDGNSWMSLENLENVMDKVEVMVNNGTEGFTIWGVTFGNKSKVEIPHFPARFGSRIHWKIIQVKDEEEFVGYH